MEEENAAWPPGESATGRGRVLGNFWLGSLVGMVLAIAAGAALLGTAHRQYRRLCVLLLAIDLGAACLGACVALPPEHADTLEMAWEAIRTGPLEGTVVRVNAYTDAGRTIDLAMCGESDFPAEERRANEEMLGRNLPFTLIRTAQPDAASNCHGWVFTGGRYWVNGIDVDNILGDNGYEKVYEPQAGDLIVYRGDRGEVYHTGVVRVAGDLVLIEGKWNCLGCYMHTPQQYPYGHTYSYYRSDRRGHLLNVPGE